MLAVEKKHFIIFLKRKGDSSLTFGRSHLRKIDHQVSDTLLEEQPVIMKTLTGEKQCHTLRQIGSLIALPGHTRALTLLV